MIEKFPAIKILVASVVLAACPWTTGHADPGRTMAVPNLLLDASRLFGGQTDAARMDSASYGSYSRGCLAGADRLPAGGRHWQAMRLSRNRNWGHPILLSYIRHLSEDAARLDGWPGLLVGDISQPRGGPMPSGHKSHQTGLDVDIWFRPSPPRHLSMDERENLSAKSLIRNRFELNKSLWTEEHARLLKRAASYSNVARIFVHPTIKKELCDWADGDRYWLRKIRAWYGHDDHFHVRLKCPAGQPCIDQDPPPAGDGCGAELSWWFSPEPYLPGPEKEKPRPLTLGDLPMVCRAVLESR